MPVPSILAAVERSKKRSSKMKEFPVIVTWYLPPSDISVLCCSYPFISLLFLKSNLCSFFMKQKVFQIYFYHKFQVHPIQPHWSRTHQKKNIQLLPSWWNKNKPRGCWLNPCKSILENQWFSVWTLIYFHGVFSTLFSYVYGSNYWYLLVLVKVKESIV